jgi:hypothetical protein
MNDPSSWPANARIKRFFHGKNTKLEEHILNLDDSQNMETNMNITSIPTISQ